MENLNELLTRIESARLWNFFHKDWLLQIRVAVRRQLPGDYRVFVESEAVLVTPEPWEAPSPILPDVSIATAPRVSAGVTPPVESDSGGTAIVEADEPCDVESHYSLVIRRAPENYVVTAAEVVSPSNKGLGNRLDQQHFLRKRSEYFDAGVNVLELDAPTGGERVLPDRLHGLNEFDRVVWTAFHDAGRRRFRGCGWNGEDPLPAIDWRVDLAHTVHVDLAATLREADEFNQWDALVSSDE